MDSTEQENAPQSLWLNVENITIRTKNRLSFAGTNWRMTADEQWAVIGPTGAGKSIFAKALGGLLPVVQGQIINYFDGTSEGRPYLKRGEIIMVSAETQRDLLQQHAGFHQARWQSFEGEGTPTVAQFLHGDPADDRVTYDTDPGAPVESVRETRQALAVDLLGIGNLLDRKLIHLSNGEGRKVLLARALTRSPKLLILDDPFGGLDAESRETLIRSLTDILAGRQQRLLLVVSRLDEIPDGITHVMGIAGHRIATQGERDVVCVSSFAREVFTPGRQVAQEELHLPEVDWSAPPVGTPLIEFHNVNVSYKGANVLQNVTWTLRQGEHWAIRGPNGAGKSTLLSLILADNPQAYANDVTVFGSRRGSGESIWDIKQQIGWVAPEIHMYYPNQTDCRAVVCSGFFDSVGLYNNVSPEQGHIVTTWIKVLGLDALAEQPFHDLSIGEQRLVLLARALVKQPRLLILDEPCQGLDSFHRERIHRILDAICRQTPVSLLYVTHHLDDLPRAINRVLHLDHGRMRLDF